MVNESVGQVLVENSIRPSWQRLTYIRFGRESDGAAVRRCDDLERDRGHRVEAGLRCGEDVLEFAKNVAQTVDHRRGPAIIVRVESDVA